MLRALLERRFRLKAHIETEQMPALALVVAPGGLKMQARRAPGFMYASQPAGWGAAGYTIAEGQALLANFEEGPKLADLRRGQKPVCGQLAQGQRAEQGVRCRRFHIRRTRAGAGEEGTCRPRAGRTDKTGITDTFDCDPGVRTGEDPWPRSLPVPSPSNVPPAPTIFVALEQQLGLRLEPTQAPREFIVIDTIERPSPN